jgi:hypothetical protein
MLTKRRKYVEWSAVAATLTAYAATLAFAIPRHEPWADEAQAWELATSTSLRSLFVTYIHYEGSPGLWHLLLWALSRLGSTYSGMHWIAGLISLATMFLVVTAAPFPLVFRLLLPFTYFFVFQYSVVARSYVLFPMVLFSLAFFWKNRWRQPVPTAVLVGLLGNVSIHGFGTAIGLTLALVIEWFQFRGKSLSGSKQLPVAVLVVTALLGFALWSILPADDAGWVVTVRSMHSHAHWGEEVDALVFRHPWLHHFRFRSKVAAVMLVDFAHSADRGLAGSSNFGLLPWLLLAFRWIRQGQKRYIIPVIILAELCPSIPFHFYHSGLLWVLFLYLWWITWPDNGITSSAGHPGFARWNEALLAISAFLCLFLQLNWGFTALRFDASNPYSPNRDGAAILKTYLDQGNKIDVAVPSPVDGDGKGTFYVTGLEPYFDTEPISNMPFRFWFWGWGPNMRPKYLRDTNSWSAVIIVEEIDQDTRYRIEEQYLERLGYRRDRVVCGQTTYPADSFTLCHAFYKP